MKRNLVPEKNEKSVAITGFCGVSLKDIPSGLPPAQYLPYGYLTNERTPDRDPWVFILAGRDTGDVVVQAPYRMTHVMTSGVVRRLEGSEYKERAYPRKHDSIKGDSEETYHRVTQSLGDDEKQGDIAGETWQRGYVHLVALWSDTIKPVFLTIEVAKSLENYWTNLLTEADFTTTSAAVVSITSHEKCVQKSKKGFTYLASWKFKDWTIQSLTSGELKALSVAWESQATQIENFLKK